MIFGIVIVVFIASSNVSPIFTAFAFEDPDMNNWPYLSVTDEKIAVDYCIEHADRVAAGQNVIQDLVMAGLISDNAAGYSCSEMMQ